MLRFYKLQNTDNVNNFNQCVSEQPLSMSLGATALYVGYTGQEASDPETTPPGEV